MWLPFTRRIFCGDFSVRASSNNLATQGPAALTMPLAEMVYLALLFCCSSVTCHLPCSRLAFTHLVCVVITAPFSCAARAFKTTKRESSTQPSEYSNPLVIEGSKTLFSPNLIPREPASVSRFARLSYINKPMRIIHAGRKCF